MKKILIVAAHPDDEVLGCGGTVARLVRDGYEAYTLILGEGVTSRDEKRDAAKRTSELKELKKQVELANKVLGVKEVFTFDLPDNRFDTVPLLDIVKIIESVKRKISPQIIFTHYENDLNVDHRLTYRALLTATRPLPDESVKEIYCFEIVSSTEWNYPLSFSPDVYFDISAHIEKKKKAMAKYKTELNDFPHPRSLDGITCIAGYWGMRTGLKYAEAFKLARMIR
jgi:LmbE family N-acetylglucosaminyl deacetylase